MDNGDPASTATVDNGDPANTATADSGEPVIRVEIANSDLPSRYSPKPRLPVMISSQRFERTILSVRTSGPRYEKGKWDRNVKSANVSLRTASARGWKTPAGSAGRGRLSMRTSSVHAAVDVDNQNSTTNVGAARSA